MIYSIIWLLSSVAIIFNVLIYNLSIGDLAIAIINVFISSLYWKRMKNVVKNASTLFLYVYIFCSTTLYALFKLGGDEYTELEYTQLSIFSNNLLFCFFISYLLLSFRKKKVDLFEIIDYKPIPTKIVNFVFIFGFIISLICLALGISKMGSEGVALPFKLSGIMTMLRINIYPTLFLIIACRNRKDSKIKKYLLLIIIWGLLECFVRLSKAALVANILPILLYHIFSEGKIQISVLKKILPIVLIFVFLYPIIGLMRSSDSTSLIESYKESKEVLDTSDSDKSILLSIYDRIFMTGSYYMNALPYVDNQFWDFSRLPLILYWGGSPGYTTYVIDGFSLDAHHSSGTTGLLDALLIGGYGLCYITLFLLYLFASYIDSIKNDKVAIKVLIFGFYTGAVQASTYSMFIGVLVIPYISSFIFSIWLVSHFCSRKNQLHFYENPTN